jgi:predicted transcriptional regulator
MDIALILSQNYRGKLWTLIGDSYEGLEWLDESPKPTEAKLESEWAGVQAKIAADAQAKIDAKASAIAKLQALGLTVQEVEVAFGLTE